MHNNYFFLIRLIDELKRNIVGFSFGEIFTQNKDEIIFGLHKGETEFYIKALLSPLFSCLSFPKEFHRAKRNSVDLFTALLDRKIDNIEVFQNDRSFRIACGPFSLVFKLYGNRANILLFHEQDCIDVYKQKFAHDKSTLLTDLNKPLDLSLEHFMELDQNVKKFIPTLGKELSEHFEALTADIEDEDEKWKKLLEYKDRLSDVTAPVYINRTNGLPELSLLKPGAESEEFRDPADALNTFFNEYTRSFFLNREKHNLLLQNTQKIKKAENYVKVAEEKLTSLENSRGYDELANIIMANLHQIKQGSEEVELFDFYTNANIKIKLKKELTPQKNAENFYRKSKNQKIEVEKLKENIEAKKKEIEKLENANSQLEDVTDFKDLKTYKEPSVTGSKSKENLGYHRFSYEGFEILLGKNAKKNDELTFKVANKNDVWLHAKDAPGSHVIIRQVPGKTPGENVLEKAASLAAYNSKRKTEGLVPVIVTERKYVRKTKDLLPGQVIVEKEKILLVKPENWK